MKIEKKKKSRKNVFQLTGSLSNTLGEATIRGFLKFRTICRRSKWKYCAGVVGCTTDMLTWSPSTPSSELSHICTGGTQQYLVKSKRGDQYARKNPGTRGTLTCTEQISRYSNSREEQVQRRNEFSI